MKRIPPQLPQAKVDQKVREVVAGFQALYYLQCRISSADVYAALERLDPLIDLIVGDDNQDVNDDDVKQFSAAALGKAKAAKAGR
jgi:hypothetical protein